MDDRGSHGSKHVSNCRSHVVCEEHMQHETYHQPILIWETFEQLEELTASNQAMPFFCLIFGMTKPASVGIDINIDKM